MPSEKIGYDFKVVKIKEEAKSTESMIVSYNSMGYELVGILNNGKWLLFKINKILDGIKK